MQFADVVFPQQLGPLTYSVPPELFSELAPGMLVDAPLRRATSRGLVLRAAEAPPAGVAIRQISALYPDAPPLGAGMLQLISWMADYYATTEGMVLKSIFPAEFFKPPRPRASLKVRTHAAPHLSALEPDVEAEEALAAIARHSEGRIYKTHLLEAPSSAYEEVFALEAARVAGGCTLIICPDIARVEHVAARMTEAFADGVVQYHSAMSAGRRATAIARMRRGDCRIVVGSRWAVFAPVAGVGLIAVLSEESSSYKDEGGIRYQARDSAVMRGYLGGIPVLLSSVCPSVESIHNARTGKYRLIRPLNPKPRKPDLRLLPAYAAAGGISGRLKSLAASEIAHGGSVLFIVHKKGYSMLRCADCGHMPECADCGVGLQFSKHNRTLGCSVCGKRTSAPELCPNCGGHTIEPAGVGMERIEDELAALGPVRIEPGEEHSAFEGMGAGMFAMGSRMALRKGGSDDGGFGLIAVLNADAYMHIPDFRATERAFSDLVHAADALSEHGKLVLQTRYQAAPMFDYLRRFDREGFYGDELKARQEHGYPPFAKLAVLHITADAAPHFADIKGVEVLGPVPDTGIRHRGLAGRWKLLIKAPARAALRRAINRLVAPLEPRSVVIDIDPSHI